MTAAKPFFRFVPAKDKTAAERMRRHRRNKRKAATAAPRDPDAVTLSTVEVVQIAARLVNGRADRRDALTAAALLMQYVRCVPANGSVSVTLSH